MRNIKTTIVVRGYSRLTLPLVLKEQGERWALGQVIRGSSGLGEAMSRRN
jgi:hypothetical protein